MGWGSGLISGSLTSRRHLRSFVYALAASIERFTSRPVSEPIACGPHNALDQLMRN
jgi:hypothetical protein